MISYFKTNDPYRLLGIIVIILAIRLPFYLTGLPLSVTELKWMLIGERLADGYIMYKDIWDTLGPLSVFIYKWINILFGKSQTLYFILSSILVVIQATIFNELLLNNKAFSISSYIPAFFYTICMNLFFDFMTLSPILMGMTFVLLAMSNLFKRMDNKTKDELFIFIGLHLGIATLFYLPNFLFLIVTITSIVLFTGSIIRRVLLLVVSYGVVMTLSSVFYFWNDASSYYHSFYFQSLWTVSTNMWINLSDFWILTIIPLLIFFFSIFKMIQYGKYINFQIRIQQVMFFSLFAGIIATLLADDFSTFQLIWFIPSLAFFLTHYIHTVKLWFIAEISTAVIILLIIFNNLMALNSWFYQDDNHFYQKLTVQSDTKVRDKKIWVIGNQLDEYRGNQLGVPFFNWKLSSELLENIEYYDNTMYVYSGLVKNLPEVILDDKNVIPAIFDQIPLLADRYDLQGENHYVLKP